VTNIPRIKIEHQFARIGINTTQAKVQVNKDVAPKMRIVSGRPSMEIERTMPSFSIEKAGGQAKPNAALPKPGANAAYNAAAIGGMGMPAAGQPMDAAAGISPEAGAVYGASANAMEMNKAVFDSASKIKADPSQEAMPNVKWEMGSINISWDNAQMQIEWDENDYMPSFNVEPHSVEIFLRDQPYIKITIADDVMEAMFAPEFEMEV